MRATLIFFALVVTVAVFSQTVFATTTATEVSQLTPHKGSNAFCEFCIEAMDQIMQQLINIIANGGVIGSCGALCSLLPNQIEQTACNLICDAVGIDALIHFLQYEDPSPIYFCEFFKICPEITGAATINAVQCIPASIKEGDTVVLEMQYTVINATGVGMIVFSVQPPGSGESFGSGQLWMPQQPGPPTLVQLQLETTPTEQESFGPGTYQVTWGLCSGDCTNKHPFSGVYATASTTFSITK